MPLYAYRCPACRDFEIARPMGQAPPALPCPDCGKPSVRRFTAPHLSHASGSVYRLIEATEQSASEPAVVGRPAPARPPAGGRISTNPLHRGLPRPD